MLWVELTVVGRVGGDAASLVELGAARARTRTVLDVSVRDQSALYGLLHRMAALGLELVELRTVPARPADVEIVVRGPIGPVVRGMLDGVEAAAPAAVTSLRVREADLGALLAALDGAPSPAAGEDGSALARHRGARSRAAVVARGPRTGGPPMDPTVEGTGSDEMGPIDYLVVEFPQNRLDGRALPLLVDLVDRGIIRVLDLVFVRKSADGVVTTVDLEDIEVEGDFDVSVFRGASSGLLDEDDLTEAGGVLDPGSSAGVLVYENAWAGPFAAALRRGGGLLVASGRIPVQSLLGALEAAEAR
ncbi:MULTISPECIES: DUF6325 family protein [unclassified Isoptericola]|uniref:DUF6325 family protein n=1 Tax=unclassified Isoptericola TaxID=2623355 RepID=UPI0036531F2E